MKTVNRKCSRHNTLLHIIQPLRCQPNLAANYGDCPLFFFGAACHQLYKFHPSFHSPRGIHIYLPILASFFLIPQTSLFVRIIIIIIYFFTSVGVGCSTRNGFSTDAKYILIIIKGVRAQCSQRIYGHHEFECEVFFSFSSILLFLGISGGKKIINKK